jgi:hypothetical protein
VTGVSGTLGVVAHKIETLVLSREIEKLFRACTVNVYVVPGIKPVAVNERVVSPDARTTKEAIA